MVASDASSMPSARKLALIRAARGLVAPLVVALPGLFWVADATARASKTPLGRDQGIFQYVAWAILHGARDYRDVRDVNGPLTHLLHVVMLLLGGGDEHRFRVLDLVATGATFALAGACVAGFGARRRPRAVERLGWALAGWTVLSAQYLAFNYWDIAQRESFFDWLMLSSVALQLVAQSPSHTRSPGLALARAPARHALLAIAGALSVAPWFGKPTYLLFTIAQLVALVLDDEATVPLRARLRAFALGGVAGAAVPLLFLVVLGDPLAYARIAFTDVPAMYRFIWPRSARDVLSEPWYGAEAALAVAGCVVMLGLVFVRMLPRRAIAIALVPMCAVCSVLAQGKSFPYHWHPVTAGIALQWLALAAWLWERPRGRHGRRGRGERAASARSFGRLVPFVASAALGLRVASSMSDSPFIKAVWLASGADTPASRATQEYFARFPEPDWFPFELRQTAAFLRERTAPSDRVQVYGMDPYVLFLAERLSATPYIYAYDLDADVALRGGTGGRPTDAQRARIVAIRDAHEADLRARIERDPPAAFVFLGKSPLMTEDDAWDDFVAHCPDAARWVAAHYRQAAAFGDDRVWLRNLR